MTVFTKSEVEGYASFSAQEYALRATALYALARAERAERVVEAARHPAIRTHAGGCSWPRNACVCGVKALNDSLTAYDEARDG